jgi:hypothetical protein
MQSCIDYIDKSSELLGIALWRPPIWTNPYVLTSMGGGLGHHRRMYMGFSYPYSCDKLLHSIAVPVTRKKQLRAQSAAI